MTMRRSRKLLLAVGAAVILGAAGIATTMSASAATSGCQVHYEVTGQDTRSFAATVTVRNLGEPASPWTLRWSFPTGQQITSGWNGVFSQTDDTVTVTNARRTTELRTNSPIAVGFQASLIGKNELPTEFTLNGESCRGTTTPAGTGATSPSGAASETAAPSASAPASPSVPGGGSASATGASPVTTGPMGPVTVLPASVTPGSQAAVRG